jgi:ankyrin repeat protein
MSTHQLHFASSAHIQGSSTSITLVLPCIITLLCRLLLRAGARMQMSEVRQAALLCSAVSEGDLQLLKRLLAAGANPNAADYDKRRPLHIAAADGNLPAVSELCGLLGADGLQVVTQCFGFRLLAIAKSEQLFLFVYAGACSTTAHVMLCYAMLCYVMLCYVMLCYVMLLSNLQVRLLVEVGAADPSLVDRWQQTPLQEATRSGAAPLVSYLSGKAPAAGEGTRYRQP